MQQSTVHSKEPLMRHIRFGTKSSRAYLTQVTVRWHLCDQKGTGRNGVQQESKHGKQISNFF